MPYLTREVVETEWIAFLKERQLIGTAVVMAVAMVFLFLFVLRPQLLAIVKFKNEVGSQIKKLEETRKKAEFLQALDKEVLLNQLKMVEVTLPSQNPVLPLIQALSEISAQTQVGMQDISLVPGELSTEAASLKKATTKKGSELIELKAQLEIVGSLEAIEQFLIALDQMAPVVKVVSINVEQASLRGMVEANLLQVSFNVIAYYSSLPKQLGRIAEELPDLSREEKQQLEFIASLKTYPAGTDKGAAEALPLGKEDLFSSLAQ